MTETCLIEIASRELRAEIDPQGAQLFSLRDAAGRDLQWNGDPAIWKGRAPILFPIVGALAGNRYRLDDHEYSLSRHGFARERLFSVLDAAPENTLLRLDWDTETFALYPFRFQLDLLFALTGATLKIAVTLRNLEDENSLPASFGFHPAFRWPLPYGEPRDAHRLRFERDEPAPVRRLDSNGLLLPEKFETPVKNGILHLRDELFEADAVIFDAISSRRIVYGADQGPQLEIEFSGMPELGIWTKPGAGFICIEPWHGFADPQGFAGDFRAKPGMAVLPPGTERTFAMSISLSAD